jgi:PilZ domain
MGLPHCPSCRKNLVHQSRREGLIEALGGLLCLYPFRCQLCTHRFLAFQWGWRRLISYDDLREYVRFPVRFQLTFSGQQVSGAGTVVNLSRQGCAIETSTPIPPGELFCLRIYEPDGHPLFEIEAAAVLYIANRKYERVVGPTPVRVNPLQSSLFAGILILSASWQSEGRGFNPRQLH